MRHAHNEEILTQFVGCWTVCTMRLKPQRCRFFGKIDGNEACDHGAFNSELLTNLASRTGGDNSPEGGIPEAAKIPEVGAGRTLPRSQNQPARIAFWFPEAWKLH